MKIVFYLAQWIIGICLCLISFGGFLNGDTVPASFILIIGLVLTPPIFGLFQTRKKKVLAINEVPIKDINTAIHEPTILNKPGKITVASISVSSINSEILDNTIIEVTGNDYNLQISNNSLIKYAKGVPIWEHQYVYSNDELQWASPEQIKFYEYYKNCFLKGEYMNLEGNTNYAFILLFDLLNDYDSHKNLNLLEEQMDQIGKHYPKTKYYSIAPLIKKFEAVGDLKSVDRIKTKNYSSSRDQYPHYPYSYDYGGLGSQYKAELSLSLVQVQQLNKLYYYSNNFWEISYCCHEIIGLYLLLIEALEEILIAENNSLEKHVEFISDLIIKNQYKYSLGTDNYKFALESTTRDIYSTLMKYCENRVREKYEHKRKLAIEPYWNIQNIKTEFENRILNKVQVLLPALSEKIKAPDTQTEIELNSQNTTQWKSALQIITTDYTTGKHESFKEAIYDLAKLNKKNPSIENIFYEASKFIARYDKKTALELYIHYLHYDLQSSTFDNKALTKTIQKSLFTTNEQLYDFEVIIGNLLKDKNLESALEAVTKVYTPKRKKITLDTESIKEVQTKHTGTVELLNEYLQDDFENDSHEIKAQEFGKEEIRIEILQKSETTYKSIYLNEITFTEMQMSTLDFFTKNNFTLSDADLEGFLKPKGVFKNQLVESINESCFETLDDILIEEEEDNFIINKDYYNLLLSK